MSLFTFFIFLLYLPLSSHISTTGALTLSSDISALQAFKASIKPTTIPSYSCLASWIFSSDPCSIPRINHFTCGLSCTNSRVTQLTLDPAGYSGTITDSTLPTSAVISTSAVAAQVTTQAAQQNKGIKLSMNRCLRMINTATRSERSNHTVVDTTSPYDGVEKHRNKADHMIVTDS